MEKPRVSNLVLPWEPKDFPKYKESDFDTPEDIRLRRAQGSFILTLWRVLSIEDKDRGLQICMDCGKSTAPGSGRHVNRVPCLDDYETRVESGCSYPAGGWYCAECDNQLCEEGS